MQDGHGKISLELCAARAQSARSLEAAVVWRLGGFEESFAGIEGRAYPLAMEEIEMARLEVEQSSMMQVLRKAIVAGRATGDIESLETSSIDVQGLERACTQVENTGCRTVQIKVMLDFTSRLLKVRRYLKRRDWKGVQRELRCLRQNRSARSPEHRQSIIFSCRFRA